MLLREILRRPKLAACALLLVAPPLRLVRPAGPALRRRPEGARGRGAKVCPAASVLVGAERPSICPARGVLADQPRCRNLDAEGIADRGDHGGRGGLGPRLTRRVRAEALLAQAPPGDAVGRAPEARAGEGEAAAPTGILLTKCLSHGSIARRACDRRATTASAAILLRGVPGSSERYIRAHDLPMATPAAALVGLASPALRGRPGSTVDEFAELCLLPAILVSAVDPAIGPSRGVLAYGARRHPLEAQSPAHRAVHHRCGARRRRPVATARHVGAHPSHAKALAALACGGPTGSIAVAEEAASAACVCDAASLVRGPFRSLPGAAPADAAVQLRLVPVVVRDGSQDYAAALAPALLRVRSARPALRGRPEVAPRGPALVGSSTTVLVGAVPPLVGPAGRV